MLPLAQRTRQWCWKYFDRLAVRLIISGGRIGFLDADLNFPEGVALTYSTPLYWNGPDAYEGATSRLLATLLQHSRLFLDIGSNMGIYAVYAGVKHPEVTTFAFEPVPAIWEKNVRFHQANGLADRNVRKLALSDQVKEEQFFLPVYSTGVEEEQTGTLNSKSWQTSESNVETIHVECTTLDHFAAASSLPSGLCSLKIDVENHEVAVLKGGREFIRSRRPWIICEILYGQKIDSATGHRINDNEEIALMIQELGYIPFAIATEGLFRMSRMDFDRPRAFKDFLFIPEEFISSSVCYLAVESLPAILEPLRQPTIQ